MEFQSDKVVKAQMRRKTIGVSFDSIKQTTQKMSRKKNCEEEHLTHRKQPFEKKRKKSYMSCNI